MGARLLILAVLAAGVVLVLGLWLWYRLRPVERREIAEVAAAADLDVTLDNAPVVQEWVARTRLWRTVGVLCAMGGLLAEAVVSWRSAQSVDIPLTILLWGLVGYWIGSVVAELTTARAMRGDGPRSASLAPRELSSYVGAWAARWPSRLAAAGAAGMAVTLALGERSWWVWACGLGVIAVAVVTRLVSRYVLDRPQPVQAEDVSAADDAVRSRSLHALGGTAVGIGIWLASISLGAAASQLLARTGINGALTGADGSTTLLGFTAAVGLLVWAVLIPILGFIIGRRLARRPFPVRRPVEVAR